MATYIYFSLVFTTDSGHNPTMEMIFIASSLQTSGDIVSPPVLVEPTVKILLAKIFFCSIVT